eukprot:s4289_g3.t1
MRPHLHRLSLQSRSRLPRLLLSPPSWQLIPRSLTPRRNLQLFRLQKPLDSGGLLLPAPGCLQQQRKTKARHDTPKRRSRSRSPSRRRGPRRARSEVQSSRRVVEAGSAPKRPKSQQGRAQEHPTFELNPAVLRLPGILGHVSLTADECWASGGFAAEQWCAYIKEDQEARYRMRLADWREDQQLAKLASAGSGPAEPAPEHDAPPSTGPSTAQSLALQALGAGGLDPESPKSTAINEGLLQPDAPIAADLEAPPPDVTGPPPSGDDTAQSLAALDAEEEAN